MPDAYMMSLRPPWAELTVTGEKTMELRRTGCAIPIGSTVYIYESGPKGRRAIVGSVVLASVGFAYVARIDTDMVRREHHVPSDALWEYAGISEPRFTSASDLALMCIHWRTGSAVRFGTPIPAPCKAAPTWRKLSVTEVIEIKTSAPYRAYMRTIERAPCTVCGNDGTSWCERDPVACPFGGGVC